MRICFFNAGILIVAVLALETRAYTLVLPHKAVLVNLRTKETQSAEAGKKLELGSDPYWLKSNDRTPALIVPVQDDRSEITLDLPSLEESIKFRTQDHLDAELDGFLRHYNGFQNQIRVKNYSRAAEILDEMKKNHPEVHFLRFLEASLLVLKGDTQGAVLQLQEGLKHHPDHADGKDLLNKLGGGTR